MDTILSDGAFGFAMNSSRIAAENASDHVHGKTTSEKA
jgi:hypothetical protein